MDGADVGMIQGGCGACFALKAFEGQRVGGRVLREEFQRHATIETGVLRAVNDAHPTTAQLFLNSIVGNCLSAERPGFRHGPVILGCGPTQVNACGLMVTA